MKRISGLAVAVALACGGGGEERIGAESADTASAARAAAVRDGVATAIGTGDASLPAEQLERGRLDPGWRTYADADAAARAGARARSASPSASAESLGSAPSSAPDTTERWEDIAPARVRVERGMLPLHGDVAGPSVLGVQILLDRALFSPGILDGYWGKNTEKAVYWLQQREGLETTGRVDEATLRRLRELAGSPGELIRRHRLTQDEVSGEFVDIPQGIYEQADLDCMCYESLAEKLAERFHASRELLQQLNPGVDLNAVSAGDVLQVPAIREMGEWWLDVGARAARGAANPDVPPAPGDGDVARIVISDGGHYLHALDASGRILYHFPSTLGSEYAPSPSGDYSVTALAWDPTWHYQPALLTGEPDYKEDAVIPPGPNNPVGIVWMQLSKEHYGIHGTSAPETIGYVTSHGCVRLTNWDAAFLGRRVSPGTPVEFTEG